MAEEKQKKRKRDEREGEENGQRMGKAAKTGSAAAPSATRISTALVSSPSSAGGIVSALNDNKPSSSRWRAQSEGAVAPLSRAITLGEEKLQPLGLGSSNKVAKKIDVYDLQEGGPKLLNAIILEIDLDSLSPELIDALKKNVEQNKIPLVTDLRIIGGEVTEASELVYSLGKVLTDLISSGWSIRSFNPGTLIRIFANTHEDEEWKKLFAALRGSKIEGIKLEHAEAASDRLGDEVNTLFSISSLKSFWLDINSDESERWPKLGKVLHVLAAMFKSSLAELILSEFFIQDPGHWEESTDETPELNSQMELFDPPKNTSITDLTFHQLDLRGHRGKSIFTQFKKLVTIRKLNIVSPYYLTEETGEALCSWIAGSRIEELNFVYPLEDHRHQEMDDNWQKILLNNVTKLLAESTTITHFSLVDPTLDKGTINYLLQALEANYFITSAEICHQQGPWRSRLDLEIAQKIEKILAAHRATRVRLTQFMPKDMTGIVLSYMPGLFNSKDSKETLSTTDPSSPSSAISHDEPLDHMAEYNRLFNEGDILGAHAMLNTLIAGGLIR